MARRRKSNQLRSRFNGVEITKTPQAMVSYYEGLGYGARSDKDEILMHQYFQQAEHFKRIKQC